MHPNLRAFAKWSEKQMTEDQMARGEEGSGRSMDQSTAAQEAAATAHPPPQNNSHLSTIVPTPARVPMVTPLSTALSMAELLISDDEDTPIVITP
eukprot:6005144-Amphidinium_carterae.1